MKPRVANAQRVLDRFWLLLVWRDATAKLAASDSKSVGGHQASLANAQSVRARFCWLNWCRMLCTWLAAAARTSSPAACMIGCQPMHASLQLANTNTSRLVRDQATVQKRADGEEVIDCSGQQCTIPAYLLSPTKAALSSCCCCVMAERR